MNESLAKNYASALYSLSLDNDDYLKKQEEMKALKQIIIDNDEFVSLLCSSFLSLEDKEEIIDKVLKTLMKI